MDILEVLKSGWHIKWFGAIWTGPSSRTVTTRKGLKPGLKHPLPNIFQSTAFKQYTKMLIEEKATADLSKLFLFLPSTTNRKEKINKFFNNVLLHRIDCAYEDFSNYSLKNKTFYAQHLDSRFLEERAAAKEVVSSYFRHIAEISDSNLIRNANSLIAKNKVKIDPKVEFNLPTKSNKI